MPAKKKGSKKKTSAVQHDETKRVDKQVESLDIASIEQWIDIVNQFNETLEGNSKIVGEDGVIECATILMENAKYITGSFALISHVCDSNVPKKVSVSCPVSIDRTQHPSEISVKVAFAEKFSIGGKVKCPDPNQPELSLPEGVPDGHSEIE